MTRLNARHKETPRLTIRQAEAIIREHKREKAERKAKKGIRARKELEAYCKRKYGMTLGAIFTASDKAPERYQNPATGEPYQYSGKGRKPAWLKGNEDKYRVH